MMMYLTPASRACSFLGCRPTDISRRAREGTGGCEGCSRRWGTVTQQIWERVYEPRLGAGGAQDQHTQSAHVVRVMVLFDNVEGLALPFVELTRQDDRDARAIWHRPSRLACRTLKRLKFLDEPVAVACVYVCMCARALSCMVATFLQAYYL